MTPGGWFPNMNQVVCQHTRIFSDRKKKQGEPIILSIQKESCFERVNTNFAFECRCNGKRQDSMKTTLFIAPY
jgi:hypothetical protein